MNPPTLWDPPLEGPGQARRTDPVTSLDAARLVRAKATSARVLLLEAHAKRRDGLTDEQAAMYAGISLSSEYATRCSELMRMGALRDTDRTRNGTSGAKRLVREITPFGLEVLADRARRRS